MFELHKFLYHYTSAARALTNILPSMTLRLGPLKDLNDPREAKTWPFNIYSRSPASNSSFKTSMFADISSYITITSLVLCCTRDDPTVTETDADRDIRSGYGHPRMWSQYADNHRGVCLVLDLTRLQQEISTQFQIYPTHHGPVSYLSSVYAPRTAGTDRAYDLTYLEDLLVDYKPFVDNHVAQNFRVLFFTKHSDWQDEWEYRWVMRKDDGKPVLLSVSNCLKAVILGADCNDQDSARILDICESHNVEVYKAYWHGWSVSIFKHEPSSTSAVSLNGIAFSTTIPCGGVFTQALDQHGAVVPVLIENNGAVRALP